MILKYTMFIISSYMCLMETKQLDKIVESHVELHMELSRTGSWGIVCEWVCEWPCEWLCEWGLVCASILGASRRFFAAGWSIRPCPYCVNVFFLLYFTYLILLLLFVWYPAWREEEDTRQRGRKSGEMRWNWDVDEGFRTIVINQSILTPSFFLFPFLFFPFFYLSFNWNWLDDEL